ncbi:hypothetical protein [Streptomyces sp. ICBB 8177]|uniref:hypothetical protein n=1 Tax=Streptomyces sp. ICBB 8177 TaxID=563922 RepID=UPI0018EE71AA|nr:hypothetical protein [Streptomyces sp. ICBB 8177]
MRAARPTPIAGTGAALLTAALLGLGPATPALADDSASPNPSASASAGPPTEAGTDFRTATAIQQGERATADASTGDYLYWAFPGDTGQDITVKATVTFPSTSVTHAASTWQIDVYDGLRRHQPCRYGMASRQADPGATSVELSCTLRTVQSYADTWSNDPLRGAYYIRLTATDIAQTDLGLPVQAAVEATASDAGGSAAADGSVTPLVPGESASVVPSGGWSSTWWSARWLWSAGGAVLAALAGIGGYALTRGRGRPRGIPRER